MVQNKLSNQKFIARFWIIIILLGIVLATYIFILKQVNSFLGPADKSLTRIQKLTYPIKLFININDLNEPISDIGDDIQFEIEPGESVHSICVRLEQNELTPDASSLRLYLIYTGSDRQLQTGTYLLNPSQTPIEIVDQITNRNNTVVNYSILPGWRIEEIAGSLATSGLRIYEKEFLLLAIDPPEEIANIFRLQKGQSLEGYLAPGAYVLPREISAEGLLREALYRFSSSIDEKLLDALAHQDLDIRKAIILASIVQREAMHDEEYPIIASVFFNRLAVGMRLETDPTVQYAVGYDKILNTWWKSPLTFADLEVDSLYNTYLYWGLPPGPISNPSFAALFAVAYPAQTPYYFFRAKCDDSGLHNFAITYEEHLANGCP